jgi:MFS family permease
MGQPTLAVVSSPTHVRLGVLGFACSLSLLTYLDRVCISRVQEDMQYDLCLSPVQMGLVFSAFSLGYALMEVPGGWMGDVWGARRVITRIVIWWSLFTALTGSIDQLLGLGLGVSLMTPLAALLGLLVVRFLFACGEAGTYPNLTRVVAAWFPFRERALAQGAIWMSARLGGFIAPFAIGRLTAALGWRLAFWVLGAIGVVWSLFFFRWFRDRPEQKPECNAAEREIIQAGPYSWKAEAAGVRHPALPWSKVLRSVNLWALCIASAGVCFGWYFYPTWQPKYLKDVHGISFEGSELLTGLPFLCGALGSLVGGGLSDRLVRTTGSRRWGRSLVGLVGFTGAGFCVLGTGFVTEAWQAVTLLCLAFFINDLAIPVIWAVCTDIGGRYVGTISGIMNMAGGVGAVLSPALTPVFLESFPESFPAATKWLVIFAILAAAWFVAALAWLAIDASKPVVQE